MRHQNFQLPQDILTALDAFLGNTQGMIPEREASKWAALAAGTSTNYVLKSGGTGANNSWSLVPGLAYLTSSGLVTAQTTATVSGLDQANQQVYFLSFGIYNPSGSTSNYSLYLNGDTTATNYYRESATASGTAWSVANANDALMGSLTTLGYGTWVIWLFRDSNQNRALIFNSQRNTTGLLLGVATIVWQNTSYISSITISGSVASSVTTTLNVGRYGTSAA